MRLHIIFILTCRCFSADSAADQQNFTVPIFTYSSNGLAVLKVNNFYFMAITDEAACSIFIMKSEFLTNFNGAEKQKVFHNCDDYSNLVISDFISLDGKLYIYFSMKPKHTKMFPSLYSIKGDIPSDPFASWGSFNSVLDEKEFKGDNLSGTVLKFNYQLYFVWSMNIRDSNDTGIYLAPMINSDKISQHSLLLHGPKGWQNTAPKFLYHKGKAVMVFSTGKDETSYLSYMTIDWGKDPMIVINWCKSRKQKLEIHGKNPAFTTSLDKTETWMVYQTGTYLLKILKIDWNPISGHPLVTTENDSYQAKPSGELKYFTNPIFDGRATDPHVLLLDGFYYLTLSQNRFQEIVIFKSDTLHSFGNLENKTIYRVDPGCSEIYAGELHNIDGHIYLYFSMICSDLRKIYFMKADNSSNLLGSWSHPNKILDDVWDNWAMHGTVLNQNDKLYFSWTSSEPVLPPHQYNVYIAPMKNPTTVVNPAKILRAPDNYWECRGQCVAENPYFFENKGMIYMIYSASQNNNAGQCFGLMSISLMSDPMEMSNWVLYPKPVFTANPQENVYSVSAPTFVRGKDRSETWLVYEGVDGRRGNKTARVEKIEWTGEINIPFFGKASGNTSPQSLPGRRKKVNQMCKNTEQGNVI